MSILDNARNIHSLIAADLPAGKLVCQGCGVERKLDRRDTARFLAKGWPKCCGYTMRWVTA